MTDIQINRQRIIQDQGIQPIIQSSDMGEAMDALFPKQNSGSVKMLGNIHPIEELPIKALTSLNTLGFLPQSCRDVALESLVLSVSRFGRGRDDGVKVAVGKREEQERNERSFLDRIMGRNKDNNAI